MVSTAKAGGGIQTLYPNGDVRNSPWYLGQAITQALTVLGFMELREEDQPAEELWLDPDALALHFDAVKARWKGDSGPEWESIDNTSMQENDFAKEIRKRAAEKKH